MSATLIRCKGIADIFVALILTVKPSIVYNSVITRYIHSLSGLVGLHILQKHRTVPNFRSKHISDASIAPGFNQSIACMVGAVGIGYVVGARCGPALHPMVCEYETIKLTKKRFPLRLFLCVKLRWTFLGLFLGSSLAQHQKHGV